jgi:methylisocitrate lyase
MKTMQSSGFVFRQLVKDAMRLRQPLQLPGAINAYNAILAAKTGFKALYLSGGGVAAASYGYSLN